MWDLIGLERVQWYSRNCTMCFHLCKYKTKCFYIKDCFTIVRCPYEHWNRVFWLPLFLLLLLPMNRFQWAYNVRDRGPNPQETNINLEWVFMSNCLFSTSFPVCFPTILSLQLTQQRNTKGELYIIRIIAVEDINFIWLGLLKLHIGCRWTFKYTLDKTRTMNSAVHLAGIF